MNHKPPDSPLCPSARAKPGAWLIGVVDERGRVSNVMTPLTVDEPFIEHAQEQGPLGKRFRFSSPCVEARCSHWGHGRCGLVAKLSDAATDANLQTGTVPLVPCAIRARCRWWAQRGRAACAVCSLVITDQGPGVVASDDGR